MTWTKGYKRKRPGKLSPEALARHIVSKNRAAMRNGKQWRNSILVLLGGQCARCGLNDSRVLQIDHVEGNGHAERQTVRSAAGQAYAKRIFASPHKYQLLCANCNWIKRSERGEYAGYAKRMSRKELST